MCFCASNQLTPGPKAHANRLWTRHAWLLRIFRRNGPKWTSSSGLHEAPAWFPVARREFEHESEVYHNLCPDTPGPYGAKLVRECTRWHVLNPYEKLRCSNCSFGLPPVQAKIGSTKVRQRLKILRYSRFLFVLPRTPARSRNSEVERDASAISYA
eukprot:709020-Rhodomonas_salina.3